MKKKNVSESIRQLLREQPNLSYNEAQPLLAAKKTPASRGLFNMVRQRFRESEGVQPAREGAHSKKAANATTPVSAQDTSILEAIGFVKEQGGLENLRAFTNRANRAIEVVESILKGPSCSNALTGAY